MKCCSIFPALLYRALKRVSFQLRLFYQLYSFPASAFSTFIFLLARGRPATSFLAYGFYAEKNYAKVIFPINLKSWAKIIFLVMLTNLYAERRMPKTHSRKLRYTIWFSFHTTPSLGWRVTPPPSHTSWNLWG